MLQNEPPRSSIGFVSRQCGPEAKVSLSIRRWPRIRPVDAPNPTSAIHRSSSAASCCRRAPSGHEHGHNAGRRSVGRAAPANGQSGCRRGKIVPNNCRPKTKCRQYHSNITHLYNNYRALGLLRWCRLISSGPGLTRLVGLSDKKENINLIG